MCVCVCVCVTDTHTHTHTNCQVSLCLVCQIWAKSGYSQWIRQHVLSVAHCYKTSLVFYLTFALFFNNLPLHHPIWYEHIVSHTQTHTPSCGGAWICCAETGISTWCLKLMLETLTFSLYFTLTLCVCVYSSPVQPLSGLGSGFLPEQLWPLHQSSSFAAAQPPDLAPWTHPPAPLGVWDTHISFFSLQLFLQKSF